MLTLLANWLRDACDVWASRSDFGSVVLFYLRLSLDFSEKFCISCFSCGRQDVPLGRKCWPTGRQWRLQRCEWAADGRPSGWRVCVSVTVEASQWGALWETKGEGQTHPGAAERAGGQTGGCSADGPRPAPTHTHTHRLTGEENSRRDACLTATSWVPPRI